MIAFVRYVPVLMKLGPAMKLVTVAQWTLDAAMAANPISLAIAGVAALVAGLHGAYEHWSAFRNIVNKTASWFASINWKSIGIDILKGIGKGILSGIAYLTGPLGTTAKMHH